MKMIKNMVNYKVNTITADDLLKYAKQFNFNVTRAEAEKVATFLRGKNMDIFDDATRARIIREIARISGPETAKELNKLFIQFTK